MTEHNTKGIGNGMVFAAWIGAILLLSLLFNQVLEKQNNPNQTLQTSVDASGMREVRLLRNRQGHYVTPGHINSFEVLLFLDTGATSISIPKVVADRIGLKAGVSYQVNTANGVAEVYATRIKKLSIGNIVLHNLHASINPHMPGEEILLGMNALKKLEMIQKGDTLTLRQQP